MLTISSLVLSEIQRVKGSGLAPWPARLTTPPPRLADFGYSNEMFEKDTVIKWHQLFNLHVLDCTCSISSFHFLEHESEA